MLKVGSIPILIDELYLHSYTHAHLAIDLFRII